MSILKTSAMRLFDLSVIGALIYGSPEMKEFGLWIAAFFTITSWILFLGMKHDSAKAIHGSPAKILIGTLVNIGYVCALIVSGSPVWAALYCLGSILARTRAASIANAPAA